MDAPQVRTITRRRIHPRASVIAAACLAGCGGPTPPRTSDALPPDLRKESLRDVWSARAARPVPPRPQSIAVVTGPAPLAYLTQQAGSISVSDDHGRQWGPVDVPARSAVRVGAATGVAAGSVRLGPGPLEAGRTYTIYMGVPPDDAGRGTPAGPSTQPRPAPGR